LGHAGFVLKHAASGELVTAIEQVWRRETYISPKLQSGVSVENKKQASQSSKNLTPRQRDIVQLFAEGYGLKEIAERLNLSLKTIEFHKHHIMAEFKLKSNADLVLLAVKKGLTRPRQRLGTHRRARRSPRTCIIAMILKLRQPDFDSACSRLDRTSQIYCFRYFTCDRPVLHALGAS
jgi:DNA-binding CsgD family transcriptional regulator